MKNGKFLAGVIAGLGVGSIIGLLFAPAKGSETRKKLLKRSRSTDDHPKVNIHDVVRRNKEKLQHHLEINDLNNSIN